MYPRMMSGLPSSIRRPDGVVIGTHDVEILVVAEDQAALADLLSNRLANLPGVRRLTPALAVDVVKNQPDWVPFHD